MFNLIGYNKLFLLKILKESEIWKVLANTGGEY
jgi:hypothetical protein